MASDMDRKRGKAAEEAGVRRVKRARLEEEGTNSEQEFALHPSDEDMFSLPLAGKDNGEDGHANDDPVIYYGSASLLYVSYAARFGITARAYILINAHLSTTISN